MDERLVTRMRFGAQHPWSSLRRLVWHGLSERHEAVVGSVIVLGMGLFAWIGPLVWRVSPLAVNLGDSLVGPSAFHPFGTDEVGRDVLARVMAGGQLDIIVAMAVSLSGGAVGVTIGLVAGLRGGFIDQVTMRIVDALLAFPPLILALAVSVGLGAGTIPASIGIAISTVPFFARLMRSEVLRVRALPFVEAAVASGGRPAHVVTKHVLPHTWQVMAIQASSIVGYAVLTLAALGFVGLGVQPPTPEWGTMITTGLSYVLSGQWWIGVFPGLALLVLVIGFNLIADGLGAKTIGALALAGPGLEGIAE